MEVGIDIVNKEFNGANTFNEFNVTRLYSLSKELESCLADFTHLEKKIILGKNLLDKTNHRVQILKLKKNIEECENQKTELINTIEKIECVISSVKDFTLFFIFIRRFYTLVFLKENFKDKNKSISFKLIRNLISEEEDLYQSIVDEGCFYKALNILSFEAYQSYFKNYAKKFFDSVQAVCDPCSKILSILIALFRKFGDINTSYFNLTEFKFFLSQEVPTLSFPKTGYELVALQYFFFYEIAIEYLKLKPVNTCRDHLKLIIKLELKIINFKSNFSEILIGEVCRLKKSLTKLQEKLKNFLTKVSDVNKEEDINKALVFYNELEEEFKSINQKDINLIKFKYSNEIKMLKLLAILDEESYLPEFLKLFNKKVGNNSLSGTIKMSKTIDTNRDALNYLFHALCRDSYYKPHSNFMKEIIKDHRNDNLILLETIELEELIEFSYFYIFSFIYTDFNDSLTKFTNKVNYLKIVIYTRLATIRLDGLQQLENIKNEELRNFFERKFKNEEEHKQEKENILEEIKVILDILKDIKRIFLDIKTWEKAFIPYVVSDMPMPEKNFSEEKISYLEEKINYFNLEYQIIEKNKFLNKKKPKKKTKVAVSVGLNEEAALQLDFLLKSLSCLLTNLKLSFKCITEDAKNIDLFLQKNSSAIGQVHSSKIKLSSSLNDWKGSKKVLVDLSVLSLPKLLAMINEFLIDDRLMDKAYKKKINECQELINSINLIADLILNHIEVIISEYENFNTKMEEALSLITNSSLEEPINSYFFSKSSRKKTTSKFNKKISEEYYFIKEKSQFLEKLVKLVRCDTDDRMIKLHVITLETENYWKIHKMILEKIFFIGKTDSDYIASPSSPAKEKICLQQSKKVDAHQSIQKSKGAISENLDHRFSDDLTYFTENAESMESQIKNELMEKSNSIESLEKQDQTDNLNNDLLKQYEIWNFEFEKWKSEKNTDIYKLFYIIESGSSILLKRNNNAFLKYLSLYHNEFLIKNNELKKYESQLLHYSHDLATPPIQTYPNQHQQWFNECFQRINFSKTLLLQNKDNLIMQEFCSLPSSFADNRVEFNNLLIFYMNATRKYNQLHVDLINEESKLNNLNRKFVNQAFHLASLDQKDCEANVLSDFSAQLDKVSQMKLAIEQEFETKQKIKKKLFLLGDSSLVNFYLSRIDPRDIYASEASKNYLPTTPYFFPVSPQQEENSYGMPVDSYYTPFVAAVYTRI